MDEALQIEGYDIGEPIGFGAFGRVFAATVAGQNDERRAIKIIDPSAFVDDDEARKRFVLEVGALSTLNHAAIVKLKDHGFLRDKERTPYLVMEYVDGERVDRAAAALSHIDRVRILVDVLDAVQHAHERNLLHRDLKPSNMMRNASGETRVLDFGMACFLDVISDDRLTQYCAGTTGYIPPEVIANPRLRTRGQDVFACGVVLFELLAGRQPDILNVESLRHVSDDLAGLDAIIRRALANADDRYPSADEFAAALRTWIRQHEVRRSLGDSPLADRLAAEVSRQEAEARGRRDREAQRSGHLARATSELSVEIRAVAEAVTASIWSRLPADAYEHVSGDGDESIGKGVRPYWGVRHKQFGHTTWVSEVDDPKASFPRNGDNFLGWPKEGTARRHNAPLPRTRKAFVLPVWAVHQTAKDKRGLGSLHGGLALAFETNIVGETAPEPKLALQGRAVDFLHRGPVVVDGIEAIRDYLFRAVAAAHGIHL